MRGAVDFYTDSCNLLPKPVAVKEAERVYCADNDVLGDFISQHCQVGPELKIPIANFLQAAAAAGVPGRSLTRAMAQRGFASAGREIPPEKKYRKCYLGLSLNTS